LWRWLSAGMSVWCLLQCLWGLFKRPLPLRPEHTPDVFNLNFNFLYIGNLNLEKEGLFFNKFRRRALYKY
jgi:hypothetical protein